MQPFTTTRNRLHCIIGAGGLPPPDPEYNAAGRFAQHPLRIYKGTRLAACWHVGGANHDCQLTFDLGATPRMLRVLTPVMHSGAIVRVDGQGIDGGVMGDPLLMGTLYRGASIAVGACGQKDCQASNVGTETIGCASRAGRAGDAVSGQKNALSLTFSDSTSFGCKLDPLADGLTAGFFNFSMHVFAQNRGDVFKGFLTTEKTDYATGAPFDAEVLPRISEIKPRFGSTAGGSDVTIYGVGFGSSSTDVSISVGGASCPVTSMTELAIHCRVKALTPSMGYETPPLALDAQLRLGLPLLNSYPAERGVRWQWSATGEMLLPTFATPDGWSEIAPVGTHSYLEGWFEPPASIAVSFMLRLDQLATLHWSSNETVQATELLASVDALPLAPIFVEMWTSPVWICWYASTSNLPCGINEMDGFGTASGTFRTSSIEKPTPPNSLATKASRWTGEFLASSTGAATFELAMEANQAAKLYVDGSLIVYAGKGLTASGKHFVKANQWYTFRLEQVCISGDCRESGLGVTLNWSQPGTHAKHAARTRRAPVLSS